MSSVLFPCGATKGNLSGYWGNFNVRWDRKGRLWQVSCRENTTSVFAAGKNDRKDIQIGVSKQPTFRMFSGGFGDAHNRAQVFAAGNTVKMVHADPRETGDLFIGEKLLA
jgi:hypothetical protein